MSQFETKLSNTNKPLLIVVAGPTAVGKTAISIELSKFFDAEILSADARQFFKEMNIGTAKPSHTELSAANHHFIDCKNITEMYSAGDFERDVDAFLEKYYKSKTVAILWGGSGLYIRAVLEGLDNMPSTPANIRDGLMRRLATEGLEVLRAELVQLELNIAEIIDIQNPQRVIRALEVNIHTGENFSVLRKDNPKSLPFDVIKIGLELPREELYAKINTRVDSMMSAGLVEEVKSLENFKHLNALQTVGYSEIFAYLNQEITEMRAVILIKQNTRRYAKRQLTWFKNKDNFTWFSPQDFESIVAFIQSKLS